MWKGFRDGRALNSLAAAAVFVLSTVSVALAQTQPTIGHYDKLVSDSVARVSRRTGILVDPRVTEQLRANARLYSANVCGTSGSCSRTIEDAGTLDRATAAVLADMAARRNPIASLAERLAQSEGGSMDALGWSTTMENASAVIRLPRLRPQDTVALQTASGPVKIGSGGRLLLATPGRSTLLLSAAGGPSWTGTFHGTARELADLMMAPATAAAQQPATGDIEAPDRLCADGQAITFSGPYAFWNWGRGRLAESDASRRANLMPFVSQHGVTIRVVTENAGACAGYCLRTLGIAFTRAIAFWRSGCDRCSGNAFVTVRLGDRVWIDRRAADRLRQVAAGTLTERDLDLDHSIEGEMQRQLTSTALFSPSAARVGYEQIDENPQLVEVLCRTPDAAAPWMPAAKALACPGGKRDAGPIRPILHLRVDETACGPASAFLACGRSGGTIELALTDSRFRFAGPRGSYLLVGTANAPLFDGQAIIMHEVAHWFGVPHAELAGPAAVQDLMSSTYHHGRWCVSIASLIMLNNAADRRWQYRVSGNEGLRRPPEDHR